MHLPQTLRPNAATYVTRVFLFDIHGFFVVRRIGTRARGCGPIQPWPRALQLSHNNPTPIVDEERPSLLIPNALAAIAAIETDELSGLRMSDRSCNLNKAVRACRTPQPSPGLPDASFFVWFLHRPLLFPGHANKRRVHSLAEPTCLFDHQDSTYPTNFVATQPIPVSQATVARGNDRTYRRTIHLCFRCERPTFAEGAATRNSFGCTSGVPSGTTLTSTCRILTYMRRSIRIATIW